MTVENSIKAMFDDCLWTISKSLAEQFLEFYPRNNALKDVLVASYLKLGNFDKANDLVDQIRASRPSDKSLLDKCVLYKKEISDYLLNQPIPRQPRSPPSVTGCENRLPLITCSFTTCRRLDLFFITMDSFLKYCNQLRLIHRFIVIDDNSSSEDREAMKERYPFVEFGMKTEEEKGHAKSMRIIASTVDTPYLLHLEDDWQFFDGQNLLTDAIEILEDNEFIGQVLFNQNYAELPHQEIVGGHEKYTSKNLRYFIHEHCVNERERESFSAKHPNKKHCNYWPHFSLRPSLIRTSVLKRIAFEDVISFERVFGNEYVRNRFCSAFLQGTRCKHIGRLTHETDDPENLNAYDLLAQPQFFPLKTFDAYVINLKRRPERLDKFKSRVRSFNFDVSVFDAVDGKRLAPSPRLNAIFRENDYKMRRGITGCALSHLKLWVQFCKNPAVNFYLIFEDDVSFVPQFEGSLNRVLSLIADNDIVFLGATQNPNNPPKYSRKGLIRTSSTESLRHYWGGAFAYIISSEGANKMLDFVETHSMTNAIDTMIQKASDVIKVSYVVPHICHSEQSSDTDIQNDFSTDLYDESEGFSNLKIFDEDGSPSLPSEI